MVTRFLSPAEGTVFNIVGDTAVCKTPGSDTNGAWALFEFSTPKGGGPPPHRHAWDESYYVLEGEIEFTVEDRTFTTTPGGYVHVGGDAVHSLKTLSDSARYLMFASPAGVEHLYEELTAAGSLPDEETFAMAAKHKLEIIG
jgi:quercetin dioxygenase-like cupin family protein